MRLKQVEPYINSFNENGKESSRTFAYWLEYMDMLHVLLNFIESERDNIWQTHTETFRSMLSYYRSFDHNRYFKWGLVYFVNMIRLKDKNLDVFNEFSNGNHVVIRAKCSSKFNTVSTDMALEQSMNRDSKTKGNLNFTRDLLPSAAWYYQSLYILKQTCSF